MRWLCACLVLLMAVTVAACDTPSGTARPSASLVELDFTPIPTAGPVTSPGPASPTPITGVWPVGWDVAFCTALADTIVAHELVIDIPRALADDARADAIGLTAELAATVPVATAALGRVRDWEPATEVKTDLADLLELHAAVATAYDDWFENGGRARNRAARQARNQVARAVPEANEHLAELADLGLSCPGTSLALEEF